MACNSPWLRLIRARSTPLGYDYLSPTPCGHCRGCIKDYIQAWTDRCTFESQTQRLPSAFCTLTYNDDHLPSDKSVHLADIQAFNKRFRYYLSKLRDGRKYRFYCSSEYGDEDFRPHYHLLMFGFDPESSRDMECLYRAWSSKDNPIGFFSVDYLTPSRIRYSMKYVHKEFSPDRQDDLLKRGLLPLFHNMSKGIGLDWFMSHYDYIRTHHGYVVNGSLRPLNRYYQDLFDIIERDKNPYDTIHKVVSRVKERKHFDWCHYRFDSFNTDELLFANPIRENLMRKMEYLKNES